MYLTTGATIAIIDDDTVFLGLLRDVLTDEGYDAHAFPDGDDVIPRLRSLRPDVTILDIAEEQGATGWARLARVLLDPALSARPLIVCVPAQELTEEGPPHGSGYSLLVKPFDLDELLELLAHVTTPGDR